MASPLPTRNLALLGSSNSTTPSAAEVTLPRMPASMRVRCAFFASSTLPPLRVAGAGWLRGTM